ncbi:MAG: response regulator [Bacteroidota bacterium]|nr:response regulator [Bacteroidota bacterium]
MMKKAILCVDDEPIVLNSLRTQLKRNFGDNYTYEIAENADDAWEVIEELVEEGVEILLIVSDWLMPGVKGDEFLIRVHRHHPAIITFMLTGQADETAVENARRNAALRACFHKPWQENELIATIRLALEPKE